MIRGNCCGMMLRRKCKVNTHWITDAEDRTVIVKKEKLTLTTCSPFNYIGDAPDRYIIEASLIYTSYKEVSPYNYVTPLFYFRNITIILIRHSILNI